MEHDQPPPDPRPDAAPVPWWLSRGARLSALLACLAAAALGLAASRTSILSAAESPSQGKRCARPAPPPLQDVGARELGALRAGLLPVMVPLGRERYEAG